MPKGFDDFKYLLLTTYKTTNFVLAMLIKIRAAQVVAETLIYRVIYILAHQNA